MSEKGNAQQQKKSFTSEREEAILAFWKKNTIFEKTLAKEAPQGEFVFYDGPPFATGLPHYGSLLSSIIKDVIPRYKTMRGYHVRRRWGWDCHGLPIENMIEKELGLKEKKDIEKMGIAAFNEACRSSVLRFADEWKRYVDRVGRWVEYDTAYKTMDVTYMESVWWALKEMHAHELLYEGRKVLLYCPHCETPLAKAEVAMDNSYRDVTEEAVTVRFLVRDPAQHDLPQNTSILAWTTTPWTLPGNVALAVGNDITYAVVKDGDAHMVLAKQFVTDEMEVVAERTGASLVDIAYEPLFEIKKAADSSKRAWYVTDTDFVTTEEGTGVVHTAVIYGEDDFRLGQERDLPMVPLLDAAGHFTDDAPKLIQGQYFKKAEKAIKEDLEKRGLLYKKENNTHSYPHCHRCDTALLYNAITSWFIDIQKIKKNLLKQNEKINWIPEHLKQGRFKNIVEAAPDWTISRNRYWASPLPIWRCDSCDAMEVIGSVAELKEKTHVSGNRYFIMRHGGSESNAHNILNSTDTHVAEAGLTDKGKKQVAAVCKRMRDGDFDLIVVSPLARAQETATMIAEHLELTEEQIITDDRLTEINGGVFDGKPIQDFIDFYAGDDWLTKKPEGGESPLDVKRRVGQVLYALEKDYSEKHILIVTHGGPARMLFRAADAQADAHISAHADNQDKFVTTADLHPLPFTPLPHNADFELDVHRPYIDAITLTCSNKKCVNTMTRIPEVVDGWVESASMPFAEYHYPFENKKTFEKRFPGDFIAEYIAQTRTWFYYMHAVAVALFGKPSFKNVVTTGNILAEDGAKMSKSKGNYTDPFVNLDRYGADALRYYLMTSVVMQAEDVRFLDDEIKEVHNRLINILWNVVRFYDTYASENDGSAQPQKSPHALDQWILSRVAQLRETMTAELDAFNTIRAGRPLREFINDLSTWYLRRSRDRFKGADELDKQYALATTQYVLQETAKLIAPFMPFLAESIHSRVQGVEESVHLAAWPAKTKYDEKLLADMVVVREVISQALEARATAGIKVRQPLATLTITTTIPEQYYFLIRDEVNVKEVRFDKERVEKLHLDTDITPELAEEGHVRELIRHIQQLRKQAKCSPTEHVTLTVATDEAGQAFVEKHTTELSTTALLQTVTFTDEQADEPLVLDEMTFGLTIQR